MPDTFEVIIIGSGPTGLTLANLLGEAGIATLLVERNASTVQEPRAVSIDDESLRSMQAIGLDHVVLEDVIAGYGSHYHGPDGRCFLRVEPTGTPYGYPRRNAFRQPILEQRLRDGLARWPGVATLFGWTLAGFTQTEDGVIADLRGPDGAQRQVVAPWLVGCDGASSPVRESLGLKLEGATFDERWLIVDLENHHNTVRYTHVYCDRRRPCITLPGPHNTRRFEFKLHLGERDEDLLRPDIISHLLATHGADLGATIRRQVVYRFHARQVPRWRVGRVFLAGDAAHLTPPFAGQGMNSGIRDAHNLGWKLAAVARGRIGPALLDSYGAERSPHVGEMIQLALRMGRIMSPRSRLHGLATRAAFRALGLYAPARDYFAQMKYKPKPRFRQGFVLPQSGRLHPLPGRLFPQPILQDAAGRAVRLDDVLGNRFALLGIGAAPDALFGSADAPFWDGLETIRVAILPQDAPAASAANVVSLWVPDAAHAAALAQALDGWKQALVVLRPDYYVLACLRPGQIAAAQDGIAALLQQ